MPSSRGRTLISTIRPITRPSWQALTAQPSRSSIMPSIRRLSPNFHLSLRNESGSEEDLHTDPAPFKPDTVQQQLRSLRECHRVLNSTGELFLRCDNLLDYTRVTRDLTGDTANSRLAMLLQFGRNIGAIIRERCSPRRQRHTLAGYKKLLKQAGFSQHRGNCAVLRGQPSIRHEATRRKIPIQNHTPVDSLQKQDKRQNRKSPPGMALIARKSPRTKPTLEGSILAGVAQYFDCSSEDCRVLRYLTSPKGKLLIQAACGDSEFYIRLPQNRYAEQADRNNSHRLQWLSQKRASLSALFPDHLTQGVICEQAYFAESAVTGTHLSQLLRRGTGGIEYIREGD